MTFESMVGDLASIRGVENRKILNTIAQDAYVITDPFRLSHKEKAFQAHHSTIVAQNTAQPYSGRLQSQPFNAQTQKLENEIANYKNDNSHIRSDIVQRNTTAVQISRYKFLDLDACEIGAGSKNRITSDRIRFEGSVVMKSDFGPNPLPPSAN